MTFHLIPSEFPYIWGKFDFLFISVDSLLARIWKNIDAAFFSFNRELNFMDLWHFLFFFLSEMVRFTSNNITQKLQFSTNWWRFLFFSYQRWSDLPVTTVFNNSSFILIGGVSYFFLSEMVLFTSNNSIQQLQFSTNWWCFLFFLIRDGPIYQ